MRLRPRAIAAAAAAGALLVPASAWAHGLVVREDLPIPEWLFGWGATTVLIASFVALAILWPTPKLERDEWRPISAGVGRALTSAPAQGLFGAIGVFLLGLTLYSGFAGTETAADNFSSTFVYVIFWLGLIPLSLLFGDVFRAFNPWRAIGRLTGSLVGLITKDSPPPLDYPARLGRLPAALGILAFAWLELVASSGEAPRNVALASLIYSAATFVCMSLYGVEQWISRGEAFGVYFNLFSRISPVEIRDRVLGLRRPLAGLARLEELPGTALLLAVMIGTVTFDGLSGGLVWQGVASSLRDPLTGLGLGPQPALESAYAIGLIGTVAIVYGFYRLGIAGARTVDRDFSARSLAASFAASLVPIALVYAIAHYVSLLLIQGQAIVFLASDPLGAGADLFGTANTAINYAILGSTAYWYIQVGFVVIGHVAALALAHDKALVIYPDTRKAVRSQYWMLFVMVGFTTLALWLLSPSNQA